MAKTRNEEVINISKFAISMFKNAKFGSKNLMKKIFGPQQEFLDSKSYFKGNKDIINELENHGEYLESQLDELELQTEYLNIQTDYLKDIKNSLLFQIKQSSALNDAYDTDIENFTELPKNSFNLLEDIKSILSQQLNTDRESDIDRELGHGKEEPEIEYNEKDSAFMKRFKMWKEKDLSQNTDYGIVDLVADSVVALGIFTTALFTAKDKLDEWGKKVNDSADQLADQRLKTDKITKEEKEQFNKIEDGGISEYAKYFGDELLDVLSLKWFGTGGSNLEFIKETSKGEALVAAEEYAKIQKELELLNIQLNKETDIGRKQGLENLISKRKVDLEKQEDLIDWSNNEDFFFKLSERMKNDLTIPTDFIEKELKLREEILEKLRKNLELITPKNDDVDKNKFIDYSTSLDNIIMRPPIQDAIIQDDKITRFNKDDTVTIGTNVAGNKNELADIISKSLQGLNLTASTDNTNLESVMKDNNKLLRGFLESIAYLLKNSKGNNFVNQSNITMSSQRVSIAPPVNKFAK